MKEQKRNKADGKTIKCSQCGEEYVFYMRPNNQLPEGFPFCSERCRMVDLGAWLSEEGVKVSHASTDKEKSK